MFNGSSLRKEREAGKAKWKLLQRRDPRKFLKVLEKEQCTKIYDSLCKEFLKIVVVIGIIVQNHMRHKTEETFLHPINII